jgi:hypothetical protein
VVPVSDITRKFSKFEFFSLLGRRKNAVPEFVKVKVYAACVHTPCYEKQMCF